MAHTKAQKAVKGNRESHARRLGVKRYGGQVVDVGNIIIRQQGTKFWAGDGTILTNDFTIQAVKKGTVAFIKRQGKTYVTVA